LRSSLLRWYTANQRDLPWRRSRDPYAIWISETMLQQTRVDTVIPYYERFLERFPDVQALASSDQEDVYRQWAGLGYYSRARNLHAAARTIVDDFDGQVPAELDDLRSLPGVGRYTAGAVASIAFDKPEPVVDGNVARVLARVLGIRDDVKSSEVMTRLWDEAAALARGSRPGDLNQALMELGATICTPRDPRCTHCPAMRECNAHRTGDATELPVKRKRKPPLRVQAAAVWLERRHKLLAVRRAAGGRLGGLWEAPGSDLDRGQHPDAGLRDHLRDELGLELNTLEALGEVSHVFTGRTLRLHVYYCSDFRGRGRFSGLEGHRWAPLTELRELPQSSLTRKVVALLQRRSHEST